MPVNIVRGLLSPLVSDPKVWRLSSQEMRPGYHSTESPANAGTNGWVQTARDTKSVRPDFRAGRGCLPSSSTTRGLWQLLFCLLTSPSQGHIEQKQFCPKSSKRAAASLQSAVPRWSSFSITVPVPTNNHPHPERPSPRQCQSPQNNHHHPERPSPRQCQSP